LRRLFRAAGLLLAGLLLAGAAGGLWLKRELAASLAQLDGSRALPGLGAPVSVERDARGVPTIRATNRLDVARALGFVHAQERFFQMDLQRRLAAGELAELLGPPVLKYDRQYRPHRFRAVARKVVARAGPEERAMLEAYAARVNAGLAALGARPPEYLLLASAPVPWRAEDSALCLLCMFIQLQDDPSHRQSRLAYMRDVMPPRLFAFLAPLQARLWLGGERASRRRRLVVMGATALLLLLVTLPWLLNRQYLGAANRLAPGRVPAAGEVALRGATTFHAGAVPFTLHAFAVGYTLGPSLRELKYEPGVRTLLRHRRELAATVIVFGTLGVLGGIALARRRRLGDAADAGVRDHALDLVPARVAQVGRDKLRRGPGHAHRGRLERLAHAASAAVDRRPDADLGQSALEPHRGGHYFHVGSVCHVFPPKVLGISFRVESGS